MKIFTQSVCSNRENIVQLLLNIFFVFKGMRGCFWEYFMFFKERRAASERYQEKYTAASEIYLENVQLLLNIFFMLKKLCDSFWDLRPLKKCFKVQQLKLKIMFKYFWLNYCDENHHAERVPSAVKNIDNLFHLASEIIEADTLHLLLISDGTQIDDNEYLESLEDATELIVCMEEQIQKLSIYFELKRCLDLKNISYPLNIDYFLWQTGWLL